MTPAEANPVTIVSLMKASARAFFHGLIDYAGLFPPASLDLNEAASRYRVHRRGPDAWMLARFICPASRLDDLSGEAAAPPWRLSVLAGGGDTEEAFAANLERDLKSVRRAAGAGRLVPEVLELRIPPALGGESPERLAAFFEGVLARLTEAGLDDLQVFFEAHTESSRTAHWQAALEGLSRLEGKGGFKIRCGGVTARAYPGAGEVALALDQARRLDVPLKATAGLHHPLYHFDAKIETPVHGFVSLFGAGMLTREHGLDRVGIARILVEEEAAAFRFEEDHFAWRDLRCPVGRIEALRRENLISFGSCSFSEPRDDLAALGWIAVEQRT